MNTSPLRSAVTGAAMDQRVPKRRGRRLVIGAIVVAAVLAGAGLIWWGMPHGLQVSAADVRIVTVSKGLYQDNVLVRANADPLHSVVLDSVESGRVEEVLAKDGALVKQGDLLFRLSNPQRNLELLARQAELAQQYYYLSNLRVVQQGSEVDHARRLADLEFTHQQSVKQNARNRVLAAKGFISSTAMEESSDLLEQQKRQIELERASKASDSKVQHDAQAQLQTAIAGLEAGLRLAHQTVAALAVRAPVAGRLTGFRLQVGETVRPDQHIGRIDDPKEFKLTAQVDEFYLNRFAVGQHGTVNDGTRDYPIQVSAIFPQIKSGRFTAEMVFTQGQPGVLNPGQSLDANITLGEAAQALLLPNGGFVSDSGGNWVYVLGHDGRMATRRAIKVGRRNNGQIEVLSGLAPGERVIVSSYASFGQAEQLQLSQ